MKKVNALECGGYYMIESKATARNSYFEHKGELERFRSLFRRYLGGFVGIEKVYVSGAGYQMLIKVKGRQVVLSEYKKGCKRKGKKVKELYVKEPWRIISEQMRIFGSVYAKWVNAERGRSGGLVKERYSRYYFEDYEEYRRYKERMEEGEEIFSQREGRYRLREEWKKEVEWMVFRGRVWVESMVNRALQEHVVDKLIIFTKSKHLSPP